MEDIRINDVYRLYVLKRAIPQVVEFILTDPIRSKQDAQKMYSCFKKIKGESP